MSLQTHYSKSSAKDRPVNSPLALLVYAVMPGDRLVVPDELFRMVSDRLRYHPDDAEGLGRVDYRAVRGAIDILSREGLCKEINGTRLERWLNSF